MKSNKKNQSKLKDALNNLLQLAEKKLQRAIDKNETWDIEHYKNDVSIVQKQLVGL